MEMRLRVPVTRGYFFLLSLTRKYRYQKKRSSGTPGNMLVVVDNFLSVFHAVLTDLDGIAVEDFSELVIFREEFVY